MPFRLGPESKSLIEGWKNNFVLCFFLCTAEHVLFDGTQEGKCRGVPKTLGVHKYKVPLSIRLLKKKKKKLLNALKFLLHYSGR